MVISFHISHSDIAFEVKFKFNEGESEIGGGATPPQTPALSWILISSVIFTLITHYYKLILPHYAAIVLSLHISRHSDIAFVVKF